MFSSTDTVLITGCGSGIGKALARQFHRMGMSVCATARKLEAIADLRAEGILTLPLDVCQQADIDAVKAALQARGLHVRMLINNAGYGAMGPLLDVPHETWRHQFEVNLLAPAALVRALAPDMIARRQGMIVNVSSISGVAPTPFASPYCASKAALNAMSDSLRMELSPFGVSVVTVQPGGIQSAFGEVAGNRVSRRRIRCSCLSRRASWSAPRKANAMRCPPSSLPGRSPRHWCLTVVRRCCALAK
jgi:short-subunit dehydrogenase